MAICSLRYSLSVTGDCTNQGLGAFTLQVQGRAPFFYQFFSPFDDPIPIPFGDGVSGLTVTNLSANTYSLQITDSCVPPTRQIVNVIISDGVCVSLSEHANTTCNEPNGSLTATTDNNLQLTQYLLYENTRGYVTSGVSSLDNFVFRDLSGGTYYVVVNDGGGCTGRSESCIIKPSTPFDYGFYIVNDSPCTTNTGKVFITGLTGTEPYTYAWSTGSIEPSISGLSNGNYSVTVIDATGCRKSKNVTVGMVRAIGVAELITIPPSCSGNDGQITIVITGGTTPYYYLGSNGQSLITFSETFSLTGIPSGNYSITITDAALCSTSVSQTLVTPNGFTIGNIGVVNSTCNNSTGALSPITLIGGNPPFTYTLTYPSGNSIQQTINGYSNQFQGLSAGTYTLTISNGPCTFTNTYTINNIQKYSLTTSSTGTTCNGSNGKISVRVSSGATLPLTYQLTGQPTISNTTQTAVTFNNLFAGNYQLTVTDALLCSQTQNVTVNGADSIDFSMVGTNLTAGNNGTIQVYITEGPAPYTIQWGNNVNGQTGLNLTNLSAGTYGVLITDANGCQLSRELTLLGYNNRGGYEIYNYCQTEFISNGLTVLKRPQNMFLEGFYDLTSGETNCVLNEAIFTAVVTVDGTTIEQPFYTSNSLGDYPSDQLWFNTIDTILTSFDSIGNVIINPTQNSITLESSCNDSGLSLSSAEVSVDFKISYDISCVCKIDPIPGPIFNTCDMIYTDSSSQIYNYVYSSDTSTLLSVDGYNFDTPSITYTNSKLWAYTTSAGSTTIREWNITLNPFTAVFYRVINLGFAIGNAIGVKSNNVLVTTNSEVTPNRYVEINITNPTPVVTNKANLSDFDQVVGSIVNGNDGNFYVLIQNNLNEPFLDYYLKIVNSSDYTTLFELELTPTILGEPSGLFLDPQLGNNEIIYLVDSTAGVYQVTLSQPNSVFLVGAIGGAVITPALYQGNSCFTPEFTLPALPCGVDIAINSISLSQTIGEYFEIRVELGSQTGIAELNVDGSVNTRYQIVWNGNIVADSLFLTSAPSQAALDVRINEITQFTQLNKYIYTPGTGNATTVFPNSDWTTNGSINVNYTASDVAPVTPTRLFGSVGNQIGVVPNYPTPAAYGTDTNIKLQFTKTLPSPSYVTVVIFSTSQTGIGVELNMRCLAQT